MAREDLTPRPGPAVYPPVGRCIYCGSRESPLGKEHIIPFGLGGEWILPMASCTRCAGITGEFERFCQREMFGSVRIRMKLPTRNPEARPSTLPLDFIRTDGRRERTLVPSDEIPLSFLGFRFLLPGIVRGVAPADDFEGSLVERSVESETQKHLSPAGQKVRVGRFSMLPFARMLAKIGHAYTVAEMGLDHFEPRLLEFILGRSTAAPYLVGGAPHAPASREPGVLHRVARLDYIRDDVQHYVGVSIRLFALAGMPTYYVIVGERTTDSLIRR